ncbi:MAG: A/G-specific adenine glycosylase [Pirellulales bacterium]
MAIAEGGTRKAGGHKANLKSEFQNPQSIDWPDADWLRRFRRRLRGWYRRHARDLPWRSEPNLYHSWVSEIMLQQTQVATVEAYFRRFIAAFPTIAELAAADEQAVLRQWEGLGYYRRARQLHQAANQIVAEHGGAFPREIEQVVALPGVGRYTAGAILSIADGQRHPILEANTIRLYARLLRLEDDPAKAESRQTLWRFAEEVLPRRDVGEFNQALMELGSLVCLPQQPKCLLCPVKQLCPTFAAGLQAEIPRPKAKKQFTRLEEVAVVVERRGQVLLRRCANGERWAGLWDFPRFAHAATNGQLQGRPSRRTIVESTRDLTGIEIELGEHLATIKHGVTRYRITLECFAAVPQAGECKRRTDGLRWVGIGQLDEYPLSTTGRKLAKLVQQW